MIKRTKMQRAADLQFSTISKKNRKEKADCLGLN